MSLLTLLPEVTISVSGNSTSQYVYYWLTSWIPCIAMDLALATLKLNNCAGNVQVTPVLQFAAVRPDKPSAPTTLAGLSPYTTDDEYLVTAASYDIATAAAGNTYVRFGVACKVSSAGQGVADVAFQPSYVQFGRLLAPWSGHLVATSTTSVFIPIGPWIPALGISAFEAAIVIGDKTGNFQLDVVYRSAATSPEEPDAWSAGILTAALSADGETNSGERTVTLTSKMWVQPGLVYKLSSGTTVGQADVTVLLGVRQA